MNSSYMKYMANPKGFTLKKWFADILKEKYIPYEALLERLGVFLVAEKDFQEFGKLFSEIYSTAYMKAVEDCRGQFEKLGVKINVVPEKASPSNQD